ncbi:MAG: hypothetical protein M0R03_17070 [Novosphingobium sp.]|nr:hypothetical protein [Novosphingobium sp.]
MVNKIIGVMIMLVIGLALLPVVNEFATDLTGVGGSLENTTTGALVDLLPVIYVIILLAGAVGYIATSRK